MNAIDRDLLRRTADAQPSRNPADHSLDAMTALQIARRTVIFNVDATGIAALMDRARVDIPGLTNNAVVQTVAGHNPDTFWAIARRDRYDVFAPQGEGFLAVLPLTEEGTRRLLDGRLDTRNPDLGLIARQSERPAGIYVWAIHAKGTIAAAIPLVLQKFSTPQYQGVSIYSRPVTKEGLRVLEPLGFQPGARFKDLSATNFLMFDRSPDAVARKNTPEFAVRVARSMEDLARVFALRGAVYMAEQHCPYDEEFDGNDFSASHLLAFKGNEPIGCMRLRYFAGFAKLERLAVRAEHRATGCAGMMVEYAIELCRKKGYRTFYAHAQRRLLGFWQRHGFEPMTGARPFAFSDFDYVEVIRQTEEATEAVGLGTDPYILIRPEGAWDEPGILERSAIRGANALVDAAP